VLRREVERHNREAGRRSQGARGRSYAQVFEAGLADRVPRRPTERQLHLASLIYKPVAVDRYGRVHVNG
jgi:putative transposase